MFTTKNSIILAIGLAAAGFFVGSGIVKFKKMDQVIEVRGLAEKTVESNEASIRLSFLEASNDLKDLNTKVTNGFNKVIEFLKAQGFTESEISKDPVSITDKDANSYGNTGGFRYSARGTILLSSNKVSKVTTAMNSTDLLLEKGVVVTDSTATYHYTLLNDIKPQMLEEATKNAKEAAFSFANTAGAKLGDIKSATQGLFSISSPYTDYDATSSVIKKVRVVSTVRLFVN